MITSLQRGLVALLIICWLSMTQGFLMQISKRTGSLGTSALVISAATRMANNGETLSENSDAPAALTEPPLVRAIEIVSIVCGTVLSPLIASLLTYGFPSNWDAFWARSIGEYTHGQRIALTAEQLGPTYVKFCQALSSRPDIVPKSLAEALQTLQDDMKPIDADTAKEIIRDELNGAMRSDELKLFLDSLSKEPVGAASIGVVFKGLLPGYGEVAVKVKRRGIRELVERDAHLLRSLASWLESIPAIPLMNKDKGLKRNRLISTELVDAVEEFFSRIFEELDYRNEAANCQDFGRLYSDRGESTAKIRVVVPEIMPHLCTDNVLVMEWVNGTKLTDVDRNDPETLKENLEIIAIGIECTLSQLLDTGRLHADPHAGNLLKVKREGQNQLGYLDFGLLSNVSPQVRDGLVCAVAYLVFAKNIEAVASLFGELQLLPDEVLNDPSERQALNSAMEITMAEALVYEPLLDGSGTTNIPILKFDKLLDALSRLVPRFRFQLPPYFINNARALSTLEGIARSLDPKFNVFQVMYPFALNRLLANPTKSPVVDKTLQDLVRNPHTYRIDNKQVARILKDSALITGYSTTRVFYDILKTSGGRKLIRGMIAEEARTLFRPRSSRRSMTKAPSATARRWCSLFKL